MQRTLLLIFCTLGLLSALVTKAQCNLNPVIMPDNLILCPNATDSLYTTAEYDTYQWYKNGKAIARANSRYLKVSQYEDAGYLFKVAVSKDNCKDTSKKVLVDGWVFASPTISSNISPSYIDFSGNAYYCSKDSLVFTLLEPYTNNVQWYNNYEPLQGATKPSYHVTGNGSYTACGSPAVCPDFTSCENIPVTATFDTVKAAISRNGDTLITGKAQSYQWSINGEKIAGATSQYYVAKRRGVYRVAITDKYFCSDISKPLLYRSLQKTNVSASPNPALSYLTVNINADNAAQIIISNVYGTKRLQVTISSFNQRINVSMLTTGTYLLQIADKNNNIIATTKFLKQ